MKIPRSSKNRGTHGFTLLELMVVIAIVAILAAIANPNFLSYRRRTYNTAAHSDIKNLFTSAQVYYTDFPAGAANDLDDFKAYGFRQTTNVDVTVVSGTVNSFSAETHHQAGDKTYTIDYAGTISDSP